MRMWYGKVNSNRQQSTPLGLFPTCFPFRTYQLEVRCVVYDTPAPLRLMILDKCQLYSVQLFRIDSTNQHSFVFLYLVHEAWNWNTLSGLHYHRDAIQS